MKTFYNKSVLEIVYPSYRESNVFLKLKTNYKSGIGQGQILMLSDSFSSVLNLGDSVSAGSFPRESCTASDPLSPTALLEETFLRHHPEPDL